MPRRRLYHNGKAVSFYAEAHVFEKLKQFAEARGGSISEELNNLMRRRLVELEGSEASAVIPSEYEAMKREYLKLMEEGRRLHRKLAKTSHYRELNALARKLGLDTQDFTNVVEIAPKLLAEWKGPLSEAHRFITLLETSRRMAFLEKRLTDIRMGMS